jgi:hypothetical protein
MDGAPKTDRTHANQDALIESWRATTIEYDGSPNTCREAASGHGFIPSARPPVPLEVAAKSSADPFTNLPP